MKNFFISYAQTDLAWAEWIAWQLEEAGYSTVLQAWDFRPGHNFVSEMQKATAAAQRTIAVISPDYLAGRFTQPEWQAAFAQDPTGAEGKLVPVRVRETQLAGLLNSIVYIELVNLEEGAAKRALINGIRRYRVKPSKPPAFPGALTNPLTESPAFPGSPATDEKVVEADPAQTGSPAAPAERREGPLGLSSRFYIPRGREEEAALSCVRYGGQVATIIGPRRCGKTSLLIRMSEAARSAGKHVLLLDFELFDKSALSDPNLFFQQFFGWLTYGLKIEDRYNEYRGLPLGAVMAATDYMEEYVLQNVTRQFVLMMDQVDRISDSVFRTDFFSMLRMWYANRWHTNRWSNVDIVLTISVLPYLLIENVLMSPVNVGHVINLEDFSPEEVAELNRRYGEPLNSSEVAQLMRLLGGYPYLVHQAISLVAQRQIGFPEMVARAAGEQGPFGNHLQYSLLRVRGREDLLKGLAEIINGKRYTNRDVTYDLLRLGLVKMDRGGELAPRCPLYGTYFKEVIKRKRLLK